MTSLRRLKGRLLPGAHEFTGALLRDPGVKTALDIGCGSSSYLSGFRPRVRTVGLDAFAGSIETARHHHVHDDYILANVLDIPASELLSRNDGSKFDLVALFDVIEHVPKKIGFELLEKCEELTNAYLLLQTPYGFVEQGPEFDNIYQRHLSAWFPHDLQGLGYHVAGCAGTRACLGYGGHFKWKVPGVKLMDFALGILLNLRKNPQYALNFVAWKDVRGIPARL